jgi:hypothetical protein|tara:strand:+ start:4115 stop:4282 length:168 start_codon:yes stop_codon:yes gene_type:complete
MNYIKTNKLKKTVDEMIAELFAKELQNKRFHMKVKLSKKIYNRKKEKQKLDYYNE